MRAGETVKKLLCLSHPIPPLLRWLWKPYTEWDDSVTRGKEPGSQMEVLITHAGSVRMSFSCVKPLRFHCSEDKQKAQHEWQGENTNAKEVTFWGGIFTFWELLSGWSSSDNDGIQDALGKGSRREHWTWRNKAAVSPGCDTGTNGDFSGYDSDKVWPVRKLQRKVRQCPRDWKNAVSTATESLEKERQDSCLWVAVEPEYTNS